VDLRGHEVRNEADVATLGQVYRDPRFETFRIIYVKGGSVVATEGISSRLPSSVAAFMANRWADQYYQKVSDRYGPSRSEWPDRLRERYIQLVYEGESRSLLDMRRILTDRLAAISSLFRRGVGGGLMTSSTDYLFSEEAVRLRTFRLNRA